MLCTKCGEKLVVLDARCDDANVVRRRRHCKKCNLRHLSVETLVEVYDVKTEAVVSKRKGLKKVKPKVETETFTWLGVKI